MAAFPRSIVATCNDFEPYVNLCAFSEKWGSLKCPHPGIEIKLVWTILINFRIQILLKRMPTEDVYKSISNGSADITCWMDEPGETAKLEPNIEQSFPIEEDKVVFLIRKPSASSSFSHNLLLSLCSWNLWFLIGSLAIAQFILQAIIHLSKLRSLKTTYRSYSTAFGIALTVLLGIYGNFLAVGLTIPPKIPPPFKSLEELSHKLLNKECKIVIEAGANLDGETMQTIYPNETHMEPKLRERLISAFKSNPPIFVDSIAEIITQIQHHHCYVGVIYKLSVPLLLSKYCGLRVIEDQSMAKIPYFVYYRKNWTLAGDFRLLTIVGSTHDLYERMVLAMAKIGVVSCEQEESVRPLSVGQLMDVFLFVIGASLFSAVIFLIEYCMKNLKIFHK